MSDRHAFPVRFVLIALMLLGAGAWLVLRAQHSREQGQQMSLALFVFAGILLLFGCTIGYWAVGIWAISLAG